MSLEVSKEERKQKALENLKRGRELRAKKLAEKKEPIVDEMSELDETPKPAKKPRIKKVAEPPIVETPKIESPKPEPPPPPPAPTPVVKPKKQYKPREPKPPVVVEKVVERVIYAPPPLDIQFF